MDKRNYKIKLKDLRRQVKIDLKYGKLSGALTSLHQIGELASSRGEVKTAKKARREAARLSQQRVESLGRPFDLGIDSSLLYDTIYSLGMDGWDAKEIQVYLISKGLNEQESKLETAKYFPGTKYSKRLMTKGLERVVFSFLIIATFILAIFFLSPNLTGYSISNLTQTTSNYVGGILLIIGLIALFCFFRKRKVTQVKKPKPKKRKKK